MTDSSLSVLLFNALLYTMTLFFVYKKKGLSIGLIIFGLFTFSSWMSFLLWQQPAFRGTLHDNPQNPLALLYLYCLLLLTIWPMFSLSKMEKKTLVIKHENIVFPTIIIIVIFEIFTFLVDLPKIDGILASSDLADLRENVYDGANSNIAKIPMLNRFSLIFSGLKLITIPFSMVLYFCYHKRRKLIVLFLIGSILSIFNEVIIMVSRGIMVGYLIYLGILLFYIRDYLSEKFKKILIAYAIPTFVVIFTFFWAISVSRFGDLAFYMLYKYSGEAMINFGGILYNDIYEPTYGRGYLLTPIFRDYITCEEKWEFIENITKINVSIFYTYIGELVVEFGRLGAILASLVLFFIQKHVYTKPFQLATLFVIFFFVYAFSYGLFVFSIQGFQGFFFVCFTIFFYKFFKFR